jgi:hypothetical protein
MDSHIGFQSSQLLGCEYEFTNGALHSICSELGFRGDIDHDGIMIVDRMLEMIINVETEGVGGE